MAYAAETVGSSTDWLAKIDAALKRESKWRDKAKKVIARYRDERGRTADSSRVNILWANTEVLKASLFTRMPKADVRRRFADAAKNNSASRVAAEVVERSIDYVIDFEGADEAVSAAIDDHLLPGRGVCWVSYEPEIEDAPEEAAPEGTDRGADSAPDGQGYAGALGLVGGGSVAGTGTLQDQPYGVDGGSREVSAAPAGGRIVSQTLCIDYVYWEDYTEGKARQNKDVPWKARRHVDRLGQFKAQFPTATRDLTARFELKGADDEAIGGDSDDSMVERWEIWDKASRKRIYIARGYADILKEDDDPYHLSGFFPTCKPLTSVTTTDKSEPIPEFLQYQDQARELDRVTSRITVLLEHLKWKGIYDGAADPTGIIKDMAKNGDDGEFVPYEGWQALKEKGGIENAVGFWPMQTIIEVLKELYAQRATLIQAIYEITGISDIIRGSTDPNETKGAQVLKARFGSMRMQKRQRAVQQFIRNLYAIIGEMVAEHFTQETLADITQIELPENPATMGMGLPGAQPMPMPMPPDMGPMASQAVPQAGPPPPAGLPNPAGAPQLSAPPAPGMQGPSPGQPQKQKPSWPEVMAILRSDKTRSYRIDVETDMTALEESADEKQQRQEFVVALKEILAGAYQAATTAPQSLPVVKQAAMFLVRTYKAGRSLEQAVEDAFDELIANPPKGGPSGTPPSISMSLNDMPPEAAAQALAMAGIHADPQAMAAHAAAQNPSPAGPAPPPPPDPLAMRKLDIEDKKVGDTTQLERDKLAHEQDKTRADVALRVAAHNRSIIDEQTLAQGGPVQQGENPIVAMLGEMQKMVGMMAQGQAALAASQAALAEEQKAVGAGIAAMGAAISGEQQVLAAGMSALAAAATAPKRLVRDQSGRAAGVETLGPAVQ